MTDRIFPLWTDEDIVKLKDWAQKRPRAEIAADLGRSVSATAFKAHRLKISLDTRRGKRSRPSSEQTSSAGLVELRN
jgi:hypothetical protein